MNPDKIIVWLKRQARSCGASGCVLGISGGIDSAVVGALCVKAFGKKNVLGLILPCHSQQEDISDGKLVARHLGIKCKLIDLGGVYDTFRGLLPAPKGLAAANLKPRLRMMTLYYYANTLGYMVAGTGNRTEISVGYFTKYGDGGVDILPIGALLKREVRALAAVLNVPARIITKPPTAGLWPGQTDEAELGISYDALDSMIDALAKGKAQNGPLAAKMKKRMAASGHKRCMPPVFVK